jgi:hypothetical protein
MLSKYLKNIILNRHHIISLPGAPTSWSSPDLQIHHHKQLISQGNQIKNREISQILKEM